MAAWLKLILPLLKPLILELISEFFAKWQTKGGPPGTQAAPADFEKFYDDYCAKL